MRGGQPEHGPGVSPSIRFLCSHERKPDRRSHDLPNAEREPNTICRAHHLQLRRLAKRSGSSDARWRLPEGIPHKSGGACLGGVKLAKLSPAHLTAFYRQLLDDGARPSSVCLVHAIVHRALGQTVRWGLLERNVADAVDAPRPRTAEVKPLSQEQARQLLATAEGDELEALWVLLLSSGARVGEALALRWEDLDLPNRTMRISRTLWWEKGGTARFGSPKSGKGREVRLSQRAVEALRHHRTRQTAARLSALVWQDNDLVFSTSTGAPLRRDTVYRHHFRPLLVRAALPPTTRLHDLRHTCATLCSARARTRRWCNTFSGTPA